MTATLKFVSLSAFSSSIGIGIIDLTNEIVLTPRLAKKIDRMATRMMQNLPARTLELYNVNIFYQGECCCLVPHYIYRPEGYLTSDQPIRIAKEIMGSISCSKRLRDDMQLSMVFTKQ